MKCLPHATRTCRAAQTRTTQAAGLVSLAIGAPFRKGDESGRDARSGLGPTLTASRLQHRLGVDEHRAAPGGDDVFHVEVV